MKIIPAIDISENKVVRLYKGDFNSKTIYNEDIMEIVDKLTKQNSTKLHLIDLDASKLGSPQIFDIVNKIRNKYPQIELEVGGGIRTELDIKKYIELDCDVIIGTALIKDFEFIKEISYKYKNKIIAGIDCLNGIVKTNGWLEKSNISIISLIKKLRDTCIRKIIYTDINRDGTLSGININEYNKIKTMFPDFEIVVSGGIKDIEDIKKCINNGFDCITGKAIYSKKLDLKKANNYAFIHSLSYDKNGLIPAIIQDFNNNEILMMAYMNKESLKFSLDENRTVFFSRKRKEIWRKGSNSGNIQQIKEIRYDCDSDTLLIKVIQTGFACHTGNRSCFYRSHTI